MALVKELPSGRHLNFAAHAAFSLLRNKPDSFLENHRRIYEDMALVEIEEPLNRRENEWAQVLQIAQRRNVVDSNRFLSPYWSPNKEYAALEIFGILIQFLDQHDGSLPNTVLPPEDDVKRYVETVMKKEGRTTVSEQLEELLDISGNNLLGAANLGFIASRHMARGTESRAYPNLNIETPEMLIWNRKIAQFETRGSSERNDAPGDTYYFWTHMFASLFFGQYHYKSGTIYQFSFEHGTEIMKFVKNQLARKPIITDHKEASEMGRVFGAGLAQFLYKQ